MKLYIEKDFKVSFPAIKSVSPILKSRFKQLQETGQEAELYFLNNYNSIEKFRDGTLQDARLFGDGYDYQIQVLEMFFLAEVKGLKSDYGSIRLTKNEYEKAIEYGNEYILVVISNLIESPKITTIENPIRNLQLKENKLISTQINYHSDNIKW